MCVSLAGSMINHRTLINIPENSKKILKHCLLLTICIIHNYVGSYGKEITHWRLLISLFLVYMGGSNFVTYYYSLIATIRLILLKLLYTL